MEFFETESVELKEKLNDSFAKEVVAFLNTDGGIIYIGVKDDGTIVGISSIDKVLRSISNVLVDLISPSCKEFVHLSSFVHEDKNIVKVEVKKGDKLYYLTSNGLSKTGCFVRIGTTSRCLDNEEIMERYIATLEIQEPKLIMQESHRDDLTFEKFKGYLSSKGIHINETNFYKNFHLLVNGKFNKMAELLADENNTSIKIAIFKGKDKSHFYKRNEYGFTCLLVALEKVLNYCDAINDTYVDLSVSPRKEKKLFSYEAFKEAWINACVHNKWIEGTPPMVSIFDDRIEIISQGGIPKKLTKKAFLEGESKPVNPELMDIFLKCNIVESSGHGVPLVVREYGKKAYKFSQDSITVTIPFDKNGFDLEEKEETKTMLKNYGYNEIIKALIELIREDPRISKVEMAKIIGKSKATIERVLKSTDIIRHVGPKKGGHWEIHL